MSTAPECIGTVDPEIFGTLQEVTRPGSQLHKNYQPGQLLGGYRGKPLEHIYEALHPLSEHVFDHFTQTTGNEPTDKFLSFVHAPGDWSRKGKWGQTLFMPGEQLYVAESSRTQQFVVGASAMLDFVPNRFMNHIVNGLVARGRLKVEEYAPGEFVRSDTYAIRRDVDTVNPAPQITIAYRAMNGFASVAQLESSRRDRLRTSMRASRA